MKIKLVVFNLETEYQYTETVETENIVMANTFCEVGLQNVMNCYPNEPIMKVVISCERDGRVTNMCKLLVNPHLEHVYAMDVRDGWFIELNVFMDQYISEFLHQAGTEPINEYMEVAK